MKVFIIILLVAILFLVGSATTTTKSLVFADQLFSNNDTTTSTTTTTTLPSESTVTTSSTTVPASTTSTPIVSPYQNFTTVEFASLDGCFANNSAEIVGITVYPFDKCTEDKSSNNNNFNISVFPTYVNSSFIRSVSYSKSSNCSVIVNDGVDNEVTTMLQVRTCFSNAFDGPALFVYFGDAPFKPLTTTTTTTTLPPTSSTSSNSNQTTTTSSSSSSSVVTGTTTTAVPFVSTSTTTTTTTTTAIPQNQPNYVEFAIYNASTACKSDQEDISVYKIGKCYHHTTDKQATSFVWTCEKSGNAVKTLFNHTGEQTCDESQNQPSQTETVSTGTCMPYSPNKKYSIIYKCVHHGNSPSSNKNDDDEEENQRKKTIYITGGAGAAVVLLVAFTVLFLIWRNKNPASGGSEGGNRNQRFEVQMSTSRHQNDDVMYTEVRPEV